MIWIETRFEFRVTLEFLRPQGLGLGSRLLRVAGLWLRNFLRRVWVQGCLGGSGRGVPALRFGLTIALVPSLWLKGFKIRLWVEGCLVFTVRVEVWFGLTAASVSRLQLRGFRI